MTEGMPFRVRLGLALAVALVVSAFAAPVALAQSPDDLPDFGDLPLPGGEDPSEEPTEDPTETPTEDPGDTGGGNQIDAPGGGVDTGAGGMAGGPDALPLAAAGAVATMGGAVLIARRRQVRA